MSHMDYLTHLNFSRRKQVNRDHQNHQIKHATVLLVPATESARHLVHQQTSEQREQTPADCTPHPLVTKQTVVVTCNFF